MINYFMFMYDIKIFAYNDKELETLFTNYSWDIGMEFGIDKWKRETTDAI